jgi:hypothetical protein
MKQLSPLIVATAVLALMTPGATRMAQAQTGTTVVEAPAAPKDFEIEVQYVLASTEDAKKSGIVEAPVPTDTGPFKRARLLDRNGRRGAAQDLLRDLEGTERGKLLTAPRIMTSNKVQAELRSYTESPLQYGIPQNEGGMMQVVNQRFSSRPASVDLLWLNMGSGVTLTPTLQENGTINLLINPGAHYQILERSFNEGMKEAPKEKILLERDICEPQLLTGLKNGETIALLGGYASLLNGVYPPNGQPNEMVIFITPRFPTKAPGTK